MRGLLAKYLLVCCCICDSLIFDMQHDHFLKMLKFDLLTPPQGQGGKLEGCLSTKNMLPCCCFYNSFKLDMQHDHVVEKKLNFDLLDPPQVSGLGGGGGGWGLWVKYLLPCCCICDSLKFDMQHEHALQMLNFDPIPRLGGGGGGGRGSAGKIFATMFVHS